MKNLGDRELQAANKGPENSKYKNAEVVKNTGCLELMS
jgi:hypothetical protein